MYFLFSETAKHVYSPVCGQPANETHLHTRGPAPQGSAGCVWGAMFASDPGTEDGDSFASDR